MSFPDISGLTQYTPEHDHIMNQTLIVVKNVYFGQDITPYDHGIFSVKVEGGFKGSDIWNHGNEIFPFSVAVPQEFALKGWTNPDWTDGGYQHPLANDQFSQIAQIVTKQEGRKFGCVWDNPRNHNNLRFGFEIQKDAEKFIILINGYIERQKEVTKERRKIENERNR